MTEEDATARLIRQPPSELRADVQELFERVGQMRMPDGTGFRTALTNRPSANVALLALGFLESSYSAWKNGDFKRDLTFTNHLLDCISGDFGWVRSNREGVEKVWARFQQETGSTELIARLRPELEAHCRTLVAANVASTRSNASAIWPADLATPPGAEKEEQPKRLSLASGAAASHLVTGNSQDGESAPAALRRTTIALVAHCDDFELGMGGTAAKLIDGGWTIHIIVLSSQRKQRAEDTAERIGQLADIREEEARKGAEALGISPANVHFLRVADTESDRFVVGRIHGICRDTFGSHRPNLPFVFSHSSHDRHSDHAACDQLARAAFRVPILKFAVASSTEAEFQPSICVDTTDWFDIKLESFREHKSQAGLKVGARPIEEELKIFDGRGRGETGFAYSEFFELGLLEADAQRIPIDSILEICDSDIYRQRLIARRSRAGMPMGPLPKSRLFLGPNASCLAMLRSGRLPVSFGYTAIDGCAEIFATPLDENRYGGFREDQVRCKITDEGWDPGRLTSNPENTRQRLREALALWRRQTSYPRALRTLLTAPAEPVTDRQGVELLFGCSDYFTVRSVTELTRRAPFGEGIGTLFPATDWWADAHSWFGVDVPPYHVSAQALILNRDPDTGMFGLVFTAYNSRSNPIAGGVGVSMAEQMTAHSRGSATSWWEVDELSAPPNEEGDTHIFGTLERGLLEEFYLRRVDYEAPRLLSACLEADMFFVTFLFAVRTNLRPADLFDRWRRAPDRQESQILALFPIGIGRGEVPPVSALSSVMALLGRSEVDPSPFLLPEPSAPGTIATQRWHHSSRMRIYTAAKHWWGDAIDSHVSLGVSTAF